jgi:hypothetical protein
MYFLKDKYVNIVIHLNSLHLALIYGLVLGPNIFNPDPEKLTPLPTSQLSLPATAEFDNNATLLNPFKILSNPTKLLFYPLTTFANPFTTFPSPIIILSYPNEDPSVIVAKRAIPKAFIFN